jgi:LuxR family transcriptional regulator, maltose regulon positive regulatory protein
LGEPGNLAGGQKGGFPGFRGTQPLSRTDLLYTKLHPPPYREKRVARTRLLEKLDAAANQRLTLVCAPAGYGKTTLLSQWIKRLNAPVGWLSLDGSDDDVIQFLRYFLTAIQQIDPTVGALIPEMLQPPRPLSGPAVLITLVNDIAASEKEFIIVLDDYQEVQDRAVHDVVEHLIEHMPDNLHIVLATRADPPFNLPQLRARGQLLEFRAADLCFSADDARLFLQDVMGLPLAEEEVTALLQKAEGWVAGLQIAAIVLQHQPDLPKAVQTFMGSHRHILDYLAIEVIERLPESTQDFLCRTAILDALEASLCDAVTGRNDSQQILEHLDRGNQFIVCLDDDRRWYRYHRLMAEALRRRTEGLDSTQLDELHRRAGAWYEEQGMIDAAIDHAFKASDAKRAARLIEDGAEAILKRSQVGRLLEWLGRLTDEQIREHHRLNIVYAWALLLKGGSIRAVREKLEASGTQDAGTLAAAEYAVIRALIATLAGDVNQGLAYSRRALDDLPAGRIFLRSIVVGNLGMVYVMQGDIQAAIQTFKESVALARDAGNIMSAVASLSNLGGLYLLQGHLKLAEAVYHQALALATTRYGQRLPVACRALLGLSEITREWNELEQARSLLEEALQLAQQYSETGELVMYLSLARVAQAQGDGERALDLVQKAQALAIQSTGSTIDDRLVDTALARLWLQQGNIAGATEWAARRGFEQGLPSETLLRSDTHLIPYDLREAEWLVYARLQLAQDQAESALQTLTALLAEAEKQGRIRRLHEILVLMALAYQVTGSTDLAVDSLERSLTQAEPEGWMRVYIDEGPPMVTLLRATVRRDIARQYCSRLLGALQQEDQTQERATDEGRAGLVEPLSERELEVLGLLADGCTNREIGERLYISLSTVKGHISNINGKLLARNRTEAVAIARQLGILTGS